VPEKIGQESLTEISAIDGYVLAGGASRRMGSDKSQLVIGGETMLRRAASALMPVSDRVAAVGVLQATSDGLPVVPDEFDTGDGKRRGSIVGLHASLKNSAADWAAVLACDMPFVGGELFKRLVSFIRIDVDAVVPVQPDGRLQPLCALYRRDVCLPVVEEMLKSGEWKLQNLFDRVRTRKVNFDEISDLENSELFFLNVNTPEEYENAKSVIGVRG
jgi:molybdopterin-guanine dinucleotide biosynthesis protein A